MFGVASRIARHRDVPHAIRRSQIVRRRLPVFAPNVTRTLHERGRRFAPADRPHRNTKSSTGAGTRALEGWDSNATTWPSSSVIASGWDMRSAQPSAAMTSVVLTACLSRLHRHRPRRCAAFEHRGRRRRPDRASRRRARGRRGRRASGLSRARAASGSAPDGRPRRARRPRRRGSRGAEHVGRGRHDRRDVRRQRGEDPGDVLVGHRGERARPASVRREAPDARRALRPRRRCARRRGGSEARRE